MAGILQGRAASGLGGDDGEAEAEGDAAVEAEAEALGVGLEAALLLPQAVTRNRTARAIRRIARES
jgi:hypothetical protein